MESPDEEHLRPHGMLDQQVEALGKLSEAFEQIEQARGLLYAFHRLTGSADLALGEAADAFRRAGWNDEADEIERELVGRNVISGRWTFQIVEDYDDNYYSALRDFEATTRNRHALGRRHVFESEMKEARRTHGHPHHESRPDEGSGLSG